MNSENASEFLDIMQRNANAITFNAILNQEVQFKDDDIERSIQNLPIEDLYAKVQIYNNLYLENKINKFNAFEINLISCVLQMVKKRKETNFVELVSTFDAMNKVYTCRVDDFLTMGNKLIKEFLSDKKHIKHKHVEIEKKPIRKKIMLTTAEKLRNKEQLISKRQYLSADLNNDIVDFANPSRVLINKFCRTPYWPEYNISKKISTNNNINQEVNFNLEEICSIVENGKICPSFHEFVADRDKSTNDDDLNNLDDVITHFDPEISNFSIDCPEESYELMINKNEQHSERTIEDSSSNYLARSSKSQDNLDSISQTLSIVDTKCSDYTFFNRKRLRPFKCSNQWKDKVKQMKMSRKRKAKDFKSHDFQTSIKTNPSEKVCNNKSKNNPFKVDFNLNVAKKTEDIKNNIVQNKFNCNLWNSCKNIISYELNSEKPLEDLTRRLEFCEHIEMIPDWCKNDMELNDEVTSSSSMYTFPTQDISTDSISRIDCNNGFNENSENTLSNFTNDIQISLRNHTNDAEMSIDDNNEIQNDEMSIDDNNEIQNEELKELDHTPGETISIELLKKKICDIIKPNGIEAIEITFKDLLLKLPTLLPEIKKENISVALVYLALLHLCNDYNLHLENCNDEIVISRG